LSIKLGNRVSEQCDIRAKPYAFSTRLINLRSHFRGYLRKRLILIGCRGRYVSLLEQTVE
jgi:hypothetical protein